MQELVDGQTEEQLPVMGYVFNIGNVRICYPGDETPYRVIDFAENQDPFYRDSAHTILYNEKWNDKYTVHYDETLRATFLMAENGKYIAANVTPLRYAETTRQSDALRVSYGP